MGCALISDNRKQDARGMNAYVAAGRLLPVELTGVGTGEEDETGGEWGIRLFRLPQI